MIALAPVAARRCVSLTRRLIERFRADRAGNVTLIFAFALIPIFGAAAVSLLQGCASAPNMFYDVQVASRLKDVFASIAASLSGVRLAK